MSWWTTDDEVAYVESLASRPHAAESLANYLMAAEWRSDWGAVHEGTVVEYARQLLKEMKG